MQTKDPPVFEPPTQEPRRWRPRDIGVGALAFLTVVTGAGVAVARGPQHEASAPRVVFSGDQFGKQTPTTPDPGQAPTTADLATALPQLTAFVAQTRGLAFTADVPVQLLDDAAFNAALLAADDEEEDASDDASDLDAVIALGLVDSRAEAEEQLDATVDDVIGFYDSEKKALCVRAGNGLTPYAQETLVHELTHALQDQHFEIDPPALRDVSDERGLTFTALVEGDATWVEQQWYDAQPAKVQDAIDDEEEALAGGSSSDYPSAFQLIGYFPYAAGPDLVQQLRDAGGQARLDAAFTNPPVSSRQVFDITAGAPTPVPVPAAVDPFGIVPSGGKVVQSGSMGEAVLALILGETPWDPDLAKAWRGDSDLTTEVDGQSCYSVDLVLDTAAHARKIVEGLEDYGYDAFAQGSNGVALRACADDDHVGTSS